MRARRKVSEPQNIQCLVSYFKNFSSILNENGKEVQNFEQEINSTPYVFEGSGGFCVYKTQVDKF